MRRHHVPILELPGIRKRLEEAPRHDPGTFLGTRRPPGRLDAPNGVPQAIERLTSAPPTDLEFIGLGVGRPPRVRGRQADQLDPALGPNSGLRYSLGVRIIALSTLKAFVDGQPVHTYAREPVMAWYRQVRAADWVGPADVKRDIRHASILEDGRVVFNVAGNKYRIVVWINYPYRVVYIRFIGTHRMYDTIDAQSI